MTLFNSPTLRGWTSKASLRSCTQAAVSKEQLSLTSSCRNVSRQKKRGMLIYTLRIKRIEIREIQIKYARTPFACINEAGMSSVLMIWGFLLETLITALVQSHLCQQGRISYEQQMERKDRGSWPGLCVIIVVCFCMDTRQGAHLRLQNIVIHNCFLNFFFFSVLLYLLNWTELNWGFWKHDYGIGTITLATDQKVIWILVHCLFCHLGRTDNSAVW